MMLHTSSSTLFNAERNADDTEDSWQWLVYSPDAIFTEEEVGNAAW